MYICIWKLCRALTILEADSAPWFGKLDNSELYDRCHVNKYKNVQCIFRYFHQQIFNHVSLVLNDFKIYLLVELISLKTFCSSP